MNAEQSYDAMGRVLYRQRPEVRGARPVVLAALFSLPWLLIAWFHLELRTCLAATGGVALAIVLGFSLDYLFGRDDYDTIHERGALLKVDGGRQVLWFSSDTLVTEIHEVMREFGETNDDQWVFEVRSGDRMVALSTYTTCSANNIRAALTRALGQPPRLIERH